MRSLARQKPMSFIFELGLARLLVHFRVIKNFGCQPCPRQVVVFAGEVDSNNLDRSKLCIGDLEAIKSLQVDWWL